MYPRMLSYSGVLYIYPRICCLYTDKDCSPQDSSGVLHCGHFDLWCSLWCPFWCSFSKHSPLYWTIDGASIQPIPFFASHCAVWLTRLTGVLPSTAFVGWPVGCDSVTSASTARQPSRKERCRNVYSALLIPSVQYTAVPCVQRERNKNNPF